MSSTTPDSIRDAPLVSSEQNSSNRHTAAPVSVWKIIKPVQGRIAFAMAISVLSSLCTLLAFACMVGVIQSLAAPPNTAADFIGGVNLRFAGSSGAPLFASSYAAIVWAAVFTFLSYLSRILASNRSHLAAFRLETILRTRLSQHIAEISLGEVQSIGQSALTKVMFDDVKALHVFVADSTPLYARAYVVPAISVLVLLWLDWRLALGALLVVIIGLIGASFAFRNSQEMSKLYNESRENVSAAVVEFVQAMPVVRTFDPGTTTFHRYQNALETFRDIVVDWYKACGFSARFFRAVFNPLPTLVILLWAGAYWYTHDSLPLPTWIAVLLFGTGMAEAMFPMMTLSHLVQKTQLSVDRIFQILNRPLPPKPQDAKTPHDSSLCFENVNFYYDSQGEAVLKDVSFRVAPGTVTALVGPSGAGKSTVATLIPRFWDVQKGRILVGGVDVRQIEFDTLMEHVAFVFQDNFLFSGTLAKNIALGVSDASMPRIVAAARAAQIHDFIQELPDGYETQVGERGTFLSGGQRQRVTIARAILQNRPILVLDEATAFADPENEAALVQALSELMRGKTVVMIAHRLSTIREVDQIVVLDNGQIVQKGRHEELLKKQGVYRDLWHSFIAAQNWALGGE